ncbi:MAG: aminopeptidase N, partial [Nocardioides sp.]
MPGTNLTRDEAAARASLLDVASYSVVLDLTTGDSTFASTTTIRFSCREPGADTFADLVDATIHEITLNGESIDPATAYADSRITLSGLAADNELVVR